MRSNSIYSYDLIGNVALAQKTILGALNIWQEDKKSSNLADDTIRHHRILMLGLAVTILKGLISSKPFAYLQSNVWPTNT